MVFSQIAGTDQYKDYIWIENNINGDYVHEGIQELFGVERDVYYCDETDTYLYRLDNEFVFSTTKPYIFYPLNMSNSSLINYIDYSVSANYIKESSYSKPYLLFLFNSIPVRDISGDDTIALNYSLLKKREY